MLRMQAPLYKPLKPEIQAPAAFILHPLSLILHSVPCPKTSSRLIFLSFDALTRIDIPLCLKDL